VLSHRVRERACERACKCVCVCVCEFASLHVRVCVCKYVHDSFLTVLLCVTREKHEHWYILWVCRSTTEFVMRETS